MQLVNGLRFNTICGDIHGGLTAALVALPLAMPGRHASIEAYQVMLLVLTAVPSVDFTTARPLDDIIMDTVSAGRHIDAGNMYLQRIDALQPAVSVLNEAA